MHSEALRNLVHRAIAAARGGPAARVAGVHVDVADAPAPRAAKGRRVVTAQCLQGIPSGGTYLVPPGARVTDLAREEAWSRSITLSTHVTETSGAWRVAVASDHGGYASKSVVMAAVREAGHQPIDLGPHDETPVDYPDFAATVARGVADGNFHVGIMIDGAGIGSAMAANKIAGVRAANCWNEASAKNAREHNYANVLTLGGRMLDDATLDRIVRTFLRTPYGAARHGRRVDKITALETRPQEIPR